MKKEPLGLPVGSVRAIISIIFSLGLIISIYLKVDKIDVLVVMTTTIVTYYFTERRYEQRREGNNG